VAIEVESVDTACQSLHAATGIAVARPPELWDLGNEVDAVKTLVVRSPDGAPLELIETISSGAVSR
jgi:hypothetical protein